MSSQPLIRRQRMKLTVMSVVFVVLALVMAGAGYTSYRINRFSGSVFRDEATPPQTESGAVAPTALPSSAQATPTQDPRDPRAQPPIAAAHPTPTPLPYGNSPVIKRLRAGERVSVLLIGIGGEGHDGGYLADSMQVMSFDPRTSTVTLISVPRDLWVLIPAIEGRGGYWGKINEAYTVGMGNVDRNEKNVPYYKHEQGGQVAAKVVAQVLGVPIDYWVSLDFAGFRQFIDAIGGVEVDVERAFTDTQYPANDDAEIDSSYQTIRFEAGPQRMNGERALQFARSRYALEDGSDFGRARRQQRLLVAVREQTFRVETIPRMFTILDALEGHLRMSFSFTEAKDLAGWAQEQARNKQQFIIHTGGLDTDYLLYASTSPGGAYILLPRDGQGEYGAIQRYVRALFTGSIPATPDRGTPGTPRIPGAPSPVHTPAPVPVDRQRPR